MGLGYWAFLNGMGRILEQAAPSIETLVWLHPAIHDIGIETIIDLRKLKCLRTLVFNVRSVRRNMIPYVTCWRTSKSQVISSDLLLSLRTPITTRFFEPSTLRAAGASHIDDGVHSCFGHLKRLHVIRIPVCYGGSAYSGRNGCGCACWVEGTISSLGVTGKLSVTLGDCEDPDIRAKALAQNDRHCENRQ